MTITNTSPTPERIEVLALRRNLRVALDHASGLAHRSLVRRAKIRRLEGEVAQLHAALALSERDLVDLRARLGAEGVHELEAEIEKRREDERALSGLVLAIRREVRRVCDTANDRDHRGLVDELKKLLDELPNDEGEFSLRVESVELDRAHAALKEREVELEKLRAQLKATEEQLAARPAPTPSVASIDLFPLAAALEQDEVGASSNVPYHARLSRLRSAVRRSLGVPDPEAGLSHVLGPAAGSTGSFATDRAPESTTGGVS
jgi:hypothetical protein